MDGRLLELEAVPGRALRAIAVAGRGGCALPELAALVGGALLGLRLWLCLMIAFFVSCCGSRREAMRTSMMRVSICANACKQRALIRACACI